MEIVNRPVSEWCLSSELNQSRICDSNKKIEYQFDFPYWFFILLASKKWLVKIQFDLWNFCQYHITPRLNKTSPVWKVQRQMLLRLDQMAKPLLVRQGLKAKTIISARILGDTSAINAKRCNGMLFLFFLSLQVILPKESEFIEMRVQKAFNKQQTANKYQSQ